jgi:2-dehydropantoate 2-reductase
MEIDAMLRLPLELAELTQVATPNLDLMVELATQRARATGQYRDLDA